MWTRFSKQVLADEVDRAWKKERKRARATVKRDTLSIAGQISISYIVRWKNDPTSEAWNAFEPCGAWVSTSSVAKSARDRWNHERIPGSDEHRKKKKNANSVSDSWIIHLSAFVKPPRSCSYIIDSIGSARVIVDRLWLLPRLLSTLLFFVFVVVYLWTLICCRVAFRKLDELLGGLLGRWFVGSNMGLAWDAWNFDDICYGQK